MAFRPTEAQLKIYDFVKNGIGNGIIDAVAGAGKTTTLMGCVSHIPNINDVIYCAFNTSIRKELQKKFKDSNQNVKVSTIHALGFQMLRATKSFRLDDYKYNQIIKEPQFFDTLIPDIDKILGYHSHPTVAELRQLEERSDILDWNVNNDHKIHLRAQRAAERVARKRGWNTAMSVRNNNIHQVNRDCLDTLKAMPEWSWEKYKSGLQAKGYSIFERLDESGSLKGYVLQKGNHRYKASEIGVGRNLMASKLERTWQKLHHNPVTSIRSTEESAKVQSAEQSSSEIKAQQTSVDYTQYRPNTDLYKLSHNGEDHRYYIPRDVNTLFDDEFDYRFVANCDDLKDMAVAIFVGLIGGEEIAVTGGGGGSQSDLPWRDKDEDDLQWARRCARMASRSLGKKQKSGFKR